MKLFDAGSDERLLPTAYLMMWLIKLWHPGMAFVSCLDTFKLQEQIHPNVQVILS
jgi:hypothetical protein